MSTAHTPGPWSVRVVGDSHRIDVRNGHVKGVAAFINTGWPHPEQQAEQRANARLMAASPELLEAAQAAWNCIGELPPTQARVEVAQLLQAAIEKATGERP